MFLIAFTATASSNPVSALDSLSTTPSRTKRPCVCPVNDENVDPKSLHDGASDSCAHLDELEDSFSTSVKPSHRSGRVRAHLPAQRATRAPLREITETKSPLICTGKS